MKNGSSAIWITVDSSVHTFLIAGKAPDETVRQRNPRHNGHRNRRNQYADHDRLLVLHHPGALAVRGLQLVRQAVEGRNRNLKLVNHAEQVRLVRDEVRNAHDASVNVGTGRALLDVEREDRIRGGRIVEPQDHRVRVGLIEHDFDGPFLGLEDGEGLGASADREGVVLGLRHGGHVGL